CSKGGLSAPRRPPLSCFFFQAEDGIRDFHVTGVQTCALPIYRSECRSTYPRRPPIKVHGAGKLTGIHYDLPMASAQVKSCVLLRSEERRVGKECGCRGSARRCYGRQ